MAMLDAIVTGHERTTGVPLEDQDVTLDLKTLFSGKEATRGTAGDVPYIDGIKQSILKSTLHNPERKKKYKNFLTGASQLRKLWNIAGLPHVEDRYRAFVLTYFQQRFFDDIMDGDTPVRVAPERRVTYAQERLANLENNTLDASDSIDAFAIMILSDIERLDPSYVPKARARLAQIMRSIKFDAERIRDMPKKGEWKFFTQDELKKHFFDLDIEGVIGMSLFLFGYKDSELNRAKLTPLGEAARIAYNIRDFSEDLKAGLCNIPKEDAAHWGITNAHLRFTLLSKNDVSKYPIQVKKWLREQVIAGRALLDEYKSQRVTDLETLYAPEAFSSKLRDMLYRNVLTPKLVFNITYVFGAEKIFSKAMEDLETLD